jgi:hypothetical protein
VFAVADEVPGLELVYEPAQLRFFQARFRPLAPFPEFAETERALSWAADPSEPAG